MGVDHGGDEGDKSLPEFGVEDANANCPPQILSYRYLKESSVAFRIRQICSAPDPAGRAYDAPSDAVVGWGGDTPPRTPLHSTPTHLRRSPCVPPEFQPDLRLYAERLVAMNIIQ